MSPASPCGSAPPTAASHSEDRLRRASKRTSELWTSWRRWRPEGKTLEFKRDLSSPDGVVCTIVAFANTAGGTLLIGVEEDAR